MMPCTFQTDETARCRRRRQYARAATSLSDRMTRDTQFHSRFLTRRQQRKQPASNHHHVRLSHPHTTATMKFKREPVDQASIQEERRLHPRKDARILDLYAASCPSAPSPSPDTTPAPGPSTSASKHTAEARRSGSPRAKKTLCSSQPSASTSSTVSMDAHYEDVEAMRVYDGEGRLDARWWSIDAASAPQHLVEAVLNDEAVRQAFAPLRQWTSKDDDKSQLTALVAELLNACSAALKAKGESTNTVRPRAQVTEETDARDDEYDGADDEFEKPDIAIDAEAAAPDSGFHWEKGLTVLKLRAERSADLCNDLRAQVFRLARGIAEKRPALSRSHVITWCGCIIRVWAFDAQSYCISRAYDVRRDHVAVAQLLVLLMAGSQQSSLLSQWQPGKTLNLSLAGGLSQWELVGEVGRIFVRQSLFGSRTAILAATLQQRKEDGVATGSPVEVFIKCSWILPSLAGHETAMQRRMAHIPGAPQPLGQVCVDNGTLEQRFTTSDSKPQERRFLEILVYTHRHGLWLSQIDYAMPNHDKALVFAQLVQELHEYAKVGLHYRDISEGNVLQQVARDASGNVLFEPEVGPRLVLIDHGNMREGMKRRQGSGPAYTPDVAEEDKPLFDFCQQPLLEAVAADDAHSATKLFRPHTNWDLKVEIRSYQLAQELNRERQASLTRSPAPPAKDIERRQRRLWATTADMAKSQRRMYRWSHRFVDDLESMTWLFLWVLAGRHANDLEKQMMSSSNKYLRWNSSALWYGLAFVVTEDEDLLSLLGSLHEEVYKAQKEVREHLDAHIAELLDKYGEEAYKMEEAIVPLLPVEEECFRVVERLLREFAEKRSGT